MSATTVTEAVLTQVARDVHQTANEKGFWEPLDAILAEINTKLLLITSEVAEAMEVIRKNYDDSPVNPYTRMTDFQGEDFIEEVADIIIRAFDLAAYFEPVLPDIGTVIYEKMAKNRKRPRKHSKNF